MTRLSAALAAVLGLWTIAAGTAPLAAADLPVAAFHGKFEGGAISKSADSVYFGVTARDADVEIRPKGDGFAVTWTSVIRQGGDPAKPDVRRKTATRTFRPDLRPGVWRAIESRDPLGKGELCWARIKDNSLIVYLMVIGDDGAYEIQIYDRKIVPAGMELVFTRLRDGEEVRTVRGRLVKTGN